MKLLFVFTGGTIGSTLAGDTLSPDPAAPRLLLEKYAQRFPLDFTYDTLSPFYALSENFSGEHLSLLLQTVEAAAKKNYDGIIVTHGTDTLSYSAAALGYAMGNASLPVLLVSSAFPLDDVGENGTDNLFAALSLIRRGNARGVFVPYRNRKEQSITLHRAARLSTSLAHTDEVFSVENTPFGSIAPDGSFTPDSLYREKEDALPPPPALSLPTRSEQILRVFPYPGMTYPEIIPRTRYILLDTYHSGTVDGASDAANRFLRTAKERGIPLFVTGSARYESARIYEKYGVIRLPLSPIAAYVKLWLYGGTHDLSLSRGGDVF